MATKEKRQPSTLTLAASAAVQKRRILGQLAAKPPGNSPGSLPAGLPVPLPAGLPGVRARRPGAIRRESGLILAGKAAEIGPFPPLGIPLNIREVARMIGCSPWTVRQTLIPKGLPVFQSGASGKLIFYRDQVVRWIEKIQGGN